MGYSRKEEIVKLRREHKEAKAAKKRRENVREKLVRFLIVCEGTKSEPHYFETLINNYSTVREVTIEGEDRAAVALVDRTQEIKAELERKNAMTFDRVWVVFDKDDYDDFNEAIKKAYKSGFQSARSNEAFAQQTAETLNNKKMYYEEKRIQKPAVAPRKHLTNEQFFQYINEVIIREKLFLNPKFRRKTIMDRFHLSKERVGAIFSKGSEHTMLNSYIQQLRLDYAAKLLVKHPHRSAIEIATECGFSSNTYFSNCFRQHFGVSPSLFRKEALE